MNIKELSEKYRMDLDGYITTISTSKYDLIITFQCKGWDNPDEIKHLNLICKDVVENEIKPTILDEISFADTHPLLWKHNEECGSLYYSSNLENKYEIFGRLWEIHENMYTGWRRLKDHLNIRNTGHLDFCSGTYGLLAQGPKRVLEEYQNIISDVVETNYVPSGEISKNVFKALILDEHYVICKSVSVAEYQQA